MFASVFFHGKTPTGFLSHKLVDMFKSLAHSMPPKVSIMENILRPTLPEGYQLMYLWGKY
jgi:hypothetical protein